MADQGKLTFTRPATGDATLRLGDWGPPKPRLQNGLLFRRLADGSGKLVFGYTVNPGSASTPDADIALDAIFADDMRASIGVARGAALGIDAAFAGDMQAAVGLAWDANVSRTDRAAARAHHQQAAPIAAAAQSHWQETARLPAAVHQRWQAARERHGAAQPHWQQAQPLRTAQQHHHQQGAVVRGALLPAWQESERLRAALSHAWQQAHLARAASMAHWQDMLRLRAAVAHHWQQGASVRASARSSYQDGLLLRIDMRPHWQEARRPPPGVHAPPPVPGKSVCYDPERLGLLVFRQPAGTAQHGTLVFICTRSGGPGPQPPGRWVIPVLEVYVSTHSISAVTLPGEDPVTLLDCQIETDDGGFCWSLQASGPEHLLDQLAPVAGLPARIRVSIDGIDWVFAVEAISRTRRFGQHRCAIQGRSITALLAAPYSPEQSWLSSATRDASQLVADALQYTSTSVDWQITDWQVPGGAWSHSGTPLTAALRIAESVGAVLRSHRTLQELIFAPRYPWLPWEWDSAVPDVEMPADIITTDSLEPASTPAYDSVYVGGMAQGILGHVVRTGYPGDLPAPQVTDALITALEAARQRGQAVLGAAGGKLTQTMTLPLLTGGSYPGLILPGYLLRVNDIGHTWRGLVRSLRISASLPVVRQTIAVERQA